MKLFKPKQTLQDLQKESDIEQFKLGAIVLQIEHLEKEKRKCIQKVADLNKKGHELKKKIGTEIHKTIKAVPDEPQEEPQDDAG